MKNRLVMLQIVFIFFLIDGDVKASSEGMLCLRARAAEVKRELDEALNAHQTGKRIYHVQQVSAESALPVSVKTTDDMVTRMGFRTVEKGKKGHVIQAKTVVFKRRIDEEGKESHWFAAKLGRTPSERHHNYKVYLSINPNRLTAEVLEKIALEGQKQGATQLKFVANPNQFSRADRIVIYFNDSDSQMKFAKKADDLFGDAAKYGPFDSLTYASPIGKGPARVGVDFYESDNARSWRSHVAQAIEESLKPGVCLPHDRPCIRKFLFEKGIDPDTWAPHHIAEPLVKNATRLEFTQLPRVFLEKYSLTRTDNVGSIVLKKMIESARRSKREFQDLVSSMKRFKYNPSLFQIEGLKEPNVKPSGMKIMQANVPAGNPEIYFTDSATLGQADSWVYKNAREPISALVYEFETFKILELLKPQGMPAAQAAREFNIFMNEIEPYLSVFHRDGLQGIRLPSN